MAANIQFYAKVDDLKDIPFEFAEHVESRKVRYIYEGADVKLSLTLDLGFYMRDILDEVDYDKVYSLILKRLDVEDSSEEAKKLDAELVAFLEGIPNNDSNIVQRVADTENFYVDYLMTYADEFLKQIDKENITEEVFIEITT